jgi:hypothetical protein
VFGLVVGGSSKTSSGVALESSTSQWLTYTDAAQAMIFYDARNNTESARIDGSGNLGIGTSSPDGKLRIQNDNSTVPSLIIRDGGTPAADMVRISSNATGTAFLIDSSGNVGIGATPTGFGRFEVTQATNKRIFTSTDAAYGGNAFVAINDAGEEISFCIAGSQLIFATDATERARIDNSGNLLVGTTSPNPSHTLEKNQAGNVAATVVNSNDSTPYGLNIQFSAAAPNDATRGFLTAFDTGATRAAIRSNGGLANFSANNVNLSDERVKTDVTPLGSYWDKIKALEVVTYKYLDQSHDDDNIGVIAQQVESVAPEFVSNDGFGETPADGVPLKSIYEADLHYATLKALQEAMTRIEALEARITALEA